MNNNINYVRRNRDEKKMNARKKLIGGLVVVVMIVVIGAVFATSQTSDKNTIRLRKYR